MPCFGPFNTWNEESCMGARVVLHEYRIITGKNHNLMLKVRELLGIYGNS